MGLRIRLAVAGAFVAVAAVALAGTGLGSATIARIAGHPASAAVRPTYIDMSGRFRSDPGWGMAQGLIAPDPVAASAVVAAPAATVTGFTGYVPLTSAPPPVSGPQSFRDLQLSRAGLIPAPACTGMCPTAGCGFLAPGCAVLDCGLLNPACGLGIPVNVCGILDPSCGLGFGFDEEHALFERLRFGEISDDEGFFGHRFFDRHRFDRSHHH